MSVLVVGSVALDSVKTPFGENKEALGGSAVYFSLAANLFTKVNLVAVVGGDFPNRFRSFLENKGIDIEGLEVKKGRTFRWRGEYGYDLNNARTISTELGVFSDCNFNIPQRYRKSKYVFLANIDPEVQVDILEQVEEPKLVASDSMDYWIKNKRKALLSLLKKTDIFMINDSEARLLCGEPNLMKAAKGIFSFGPEIVVIKKGEHGVSFFYKNKFRFLFPAYPVENIFDPTGCGDSFAGGFMGCLIQQGKITKSSLRKAIVCGSAVASYNAESLGTRRISKLSIKEVKGRIREFKKLTHFDV